MKPVYVVACTNLRRLSFVTSTEIRGEVRICFLGEGAIAPSHSEHGNVCI